MVNYPGKIPNNPVVLNNSQNADRQILPFLGGALIGGAAVGLTRPRPIYNVAPQPYPYPPVPVYPPYGPYPYPRPYTNMSYSYNSFQ